MFHGSSILPEHTGLIALTFVGYLIVLLLTGFVARRRTAGLSDFMAGGRSPGPCLTALGAEATDMSGWLLMGLPGLAYAAGFQSVWLALGLAIGTYCSWRLVAVPLRRETERWGGSLTLADYFAHRYADDSRILRRLAAFFTLLFLTFYAASGFVAAGRLLQTLFGLGYPMALAFGAATVLLGSFGGSFFAASWAVMLNGSLMFLALLLAAAAGVYLNGGPGGIADTLGAFNPALLSPWLKPDGEPLGWIGIAALLAWGLGYPGQPQVLSRCMAIGRAEDIPLATRWATAWLAIALAAAVSVGYTGIGVLEGPLPGAATEEVFIHMSVQLFAPAVAALCLSGMLAAVLGSTAAKLLLASSAFARDFYQGMLRPGCGGGELLWVGRGSLAGVALAAYGVALDPQSTVLVLLAHAWAGFGAAFGPPLVLSLYWRGMTRNGALAGMAAGGATVLLWGRWQEGRFDLYALLPAFVFSALAVLAASRWGKGA